MLNEGHTTLRRKHRKWSGVWIDMYTEQTFKKFTKSRSGIIRGGSMTESQSATGILIHYRSGVFSEVACAMSFLTNI